jgi:hypothetical protein
VSPTFGGLLGGIPAELGARSSRSVRVTHHALVCATRLRNDQAGAGEAVRIFFNDSQEFRESNIFCSARSRVWLHSFRVQLVQIFEVLGLRTAKALQSALSTRDFVAEQPIRKSNQQPRTP